MKQATLPMVMTMILATCGWTLVTYLPVYAGNSPAGGNSGNNGGGSTFTPLGNPSFPLSPQPTSPNILVAPNGRISLTPAAQNNLNIAAASLVDSLLASNDPSDQCIATLLTAKKGSVMPACTKKIWESLVKSGFSPDVADELLQSLQGLIDLAKENKVDPNQLQQSITLLNKGITIAMNQQKDTSQGKSFVGVSDIKVINKSLRLLRDSTK